MNFAGKNILVTGASSGIGRAAAVYLSECGAKLFVSGRNADKLAETFSLLNKKNEHQQIAADLNEDAEIQKLISAVESIDGVVFSAGIVKPFPVKFINRKVADELMNINFMSPALITAGLLKNKKINSGASLVYMSSVSSHFSHKGGAMYSAAKAALESFSKTVAIENADKKIRANCICAAMVKTPMFDNAQSAASRELMEAHGKHYPLGFGETKDIVAAISYLLGEESRWVTGTNIVLDGGLTAGT